MIVAKYKFDSSVYSNLIPIFNDGYEGYTVSDEIDSENSNHIIRTIECDVLPTKIDFGVGGNVEQYTNRSDSLLAIYNLDTSAITNGNRMVKGCRNMTEINTSDWDTSNMVDMSGMFGYCDKLTSIDVSNFNTNNVKYINAMFYDCNQLTSLDVSNFNTSNVTDMGYMFANCRNLTSLDVSNFNTSNVTNMQSMFDNCNNLTSLDVSNWDTKNVADMNAMFCDCTNLTSLDVSNFDTSNVINIGWMFGGCQKLTSLDVSNWDTSKVTGMHGMFNSCYNLLSLDVSRWNTNNVTDMNNMFNFCYLLGNIDLSNWDTSKVKYVNGMFGRCRQMTMIDISNFDMSAIKTTNEDNYYHMFTEISNVKTLIFGNNKFPDDVDFIKLFGDTQPPSLEKIIVLEENTVNKLTDVLPDRSSELPGVIVTNATISDEAISTISSKNWSIRKMVAQYKYDANTYENLLPTFNAEFTADKYRVIDNVYEHSIIINEDEWTTISNNDTTKYSKMYNVIPNVLYLIPVGYLGVSIYWFDENKNKIKEDWWGGGNVRLFKAPSNARYAQFLQGVLNNEQQSVIKAKLVNRTIESVNGDLPTLMRFGRAWISGETATDSRTDSLLKVLDINTSELTDCISMFRYNTNLTSINCNWDTSNVTTMYCMFHNCLNLASLDTSNWNTSNVNNMTNMFHSCTKLTSLDVSNFDTSNVTDISNMFYNCYKLVSLDVSNFDTSNVTDMTYMFAYCASLTSLDVSNFDTSNVTTMQYMFRSCNKLTSLDVSNWDTKNVTNMQYMFQYCNNLTSLDVSNFDTKNVTNMQYMFYDCNNLTSLDVSNWDTSNVSHMVYMFQNCYKLTSLDVSNFNTSKVTNMNSMFYNCNNLTLLDVSNWNTSNVNNMTNMFAGCANLTSLDVSNFNTSKVTDMREMFRDTSKLSDIGMLYCTPSTINTISSNLPTTHTQTIWVQDTKPNECTIVSGVEFKEYKENGVMINLSSPLLQGDRIEVVDGKLCHYHKMGKVVLDGSENWSTKQNNDSTMFFQFYWLASKVKVPENNSTKANLINDYFKIEVSSLNYYINQVTEGLDYNTSLNIGIRILRTKLETQDVNGFKQWLQQNPITVIYELAEPYYEDITPIQSDITLETYLECNLDIYTDLPIKANLTYLTNITNTSSIEEEINAINEGTDLTNLLDDEINN